MSADGRRDQLAEALAGHQSRFSPVRGAWVGQRWTVTGCSCGWTLDGVTPLSAHQADALLPTVEAMIADAEREAAARGAADALEAAAREMNGGSDGDGEQFIEVALGGAPYVVGWLRDRAAACRTPPQETP